jgi:tetratricopeptide (TPR) repeat protein
MRPLLVAFTLAVLLCPLARAQEDIPEAARALLEEAQVAQNAGRDDEAIAKYRDVLARVPSATTAYVSLGALLYKHGDNAKALDVFANGLTYAPANRALLGNAATVALQLGKAKEALAYADRALKIESVDADLHALRGSILRALDRSKDAVAELQLAMKQAPGEAKHPFNLGNTLYALGMKDEAIAAYREAIVRDKSYLRAWFNLGAVLYDTQRYDEARNAYLVALQPIETAFAEGQTVDVSNARAYLNLGAIYFKQKRWPEALDAYKKALLLDSTEVAGFYNIGFIYFTTGDLTRAENAYTQALKLNPDLPLAYLHLGLINARRNAYEAAIRYLEQALPRVDADGRREALHALASAQSHLGNAKAAEETYKRALSEQPNDSESLLGLARIARNGGHIAEARAYADRAIAAAPGNAAILLESAAIARAAGDHASARSAYLEILKHNDLWPVRANLAFLLMREGSPADAAQQLELASRNADAASKPAIDVARGALLAATGRGAEAATLFAHYDTPAAVNAGAALKIDSSDRAAAIDALQQTLARGAGTLEPLVRGNLGLALWLDGKNADAREHLNAAATAVPKWAALQIALGAIALADGKYDEAIAKLGACSQRDALANAGNVMQMIVGSHAELCARANQWLGTALVGSAGETLSRSLRSTDARAELDRALALPLDVKTQALALYLRGTTRVASGDDSEARDDLTKALAAGLPPALAANAHNNLGVALQRLGATDAAARELELARRGRVKAATLNLAIATEADKPADAARLYEEYINAGGAREAQVREWLKSTRRNEP